MWLGRARKNNTIVIAASAIGMMAAYAVAVKTPSFAGRVLPQETSKRMEVMQVAALKEIVRAVNAGDAKKYAIVYGPDAVIKIYGGEELKGRDAIEKYEVDLLRQFPGTQIAFETVWQKDLVVVVHYAVNGQTPVGQAMGHEGLLFYQFQASGLIAEERRYLDSLTPMGQLGALGKVPVRRPPTLRTEMEVHLAKDSSEEKKNIVTARASLAALDTKNEAVFFEHMTEDAIVDDLIYPQPFAGRQELKAWFETEAAAVHAQGEITSILGAGDSVLVETILRGSLKGALGPVLAPQPPKEFAVHRAAILQLRNSKIARISFFMNGKELAEAVGEWPLAVMTSH